MSEFNPLLFGLNMAQGGASLLSGFLSGNAAADQGRFQKEMFEMNARFADLEAEDAIRQGHLQAHRVRKNTLAIAGAQRAALAAQGIEVDSGSAAITQRDTERMGYLDVLTTKNNAFRAAWGLKVQAMSGRTQGNLAMLAGQNRQADSLISGGLGFLQGTTKAIEYGWGAKSSDGLEKAWDRKSTGGDSQYGGLGVNMKLPGVP